MHVNSTCRGKCRKNEKRGVQRKNANCVKIVQNGLNLRIKYGMI